MSDSPEETFDPYWEWLEIPAEDQPPSYYRLLGLEDFEDDLAAIDAAAKVVLNSIAALAYFEWTTGDPPRQPFVPK